jgi:hypothetical protein
MLYLLIPPLCKAERGIKGVSSWGIERCKETISAEKNDGLKTSMTNFF